MKKNSMCPFFGRNTLENIQHPIPLLTQFNHDIFLNNNNAECDVIFHWKGFIGNQTV